MNSRHPAVALCVLLAACSSEEPTQPSADVAVGVCESGDGQLLHVPSPDWRDQVVYMLFLDRFDDGDPSNNDQGQGEYDPAKPTHFSGGDIRGVINQIDYLKSLGATALWISPPVENQWWSSIYDATGWHGYWATNFRKMDPHFGTLDEYKQLAHELHCNGMYLIQDIVANHTANWWTYDGKYNPEDTAENFRLVESDSFQPAPTQAPFDMIDRHNPEHYEADIYHWTPSITDYADVSKRFTYQLGYLADINTENEVVIDALKDSYKYWMSEVGVDGFRIDTVIYVPHEFWHRFAHDEDGIYAHAESLGKEHFLSFGETYLLSDPFDDAGERELIEFYGTEEKPGLNSMLGFPLFQELNRVLGQGQAPSLLEYRLNRFMELYPDPYVVPNFVDNHDTPRFLSNGHVAALKQALGVVFTVPGIPIIYQGTEQALPETRMAMFAGGHRNEEGSFDSQSEMYRFIQRLTTLRRDHRVLTLGSLDVISAESAGPGLFAYRREYEGDVAVIILNSADHSILVDSLDVGVPPGAVLDPVFGEGSDDRYVVDDAGRLSARLPPRAFVVLKATGELERTAASDPVNLVVDPVAAEQPFAADFELSGRIDVPGAALQLIINGNVDGAADFTADADGAWTVQVPVRDLGRASNYAQVFAPGSNELSERITYKTEVLEAELALTEDDAADDAFGPTGNYVGPQHQESRRQREIESIQARMAGRNLELTLTMAEVSDNWMPPNGFDNVAITTFVDLPGREGGKELPQLGASMPDGLDWDLAHFGSGWISYTYRPEGATAERQGEKFGVSPLVRANKEEETITFFYEGDKLGVDDWSGATIYVTTWEASGEGVYVDFQPEPSEWFFSGGDNSDPKIMDDVILTLEAN